jgi:quercetin dioxygenase-like cupin family protein
MKGIVRNASVVTPTPVDRARKTTIQVLIGASDGAPNFLTRKFRMEPGGRIPCHKHPGIEHEQFVLSGHMRIGIGDDVREVRAGEAIFIPADVPHWYENAADEPVEFLCMVPKTSGYPTDWLEEPADTGPGP